jgi:phosphoglycerate dehydrogenase-like enzyme
MNGISTCEHHKTEQSPSKSGHLVFALTREEYDLFLPGWEKGFRSGLRQSWIDPSEAAPEDFGSRLEALRPTILVTAWSCPPLPKEWVLSPLCSLKYICSITGSVKPRVPREALEKGILVSNWGNLISYSVAEHGFLMMLACLRNLPLWGGLIEKPRTMFEMMPLLKTRTLRGKRVGLHGFGAVARELVHMFKPHHVHLQAWSHGVPRALYSEYDVTPCSSPEALFSSSDILLECEGLNEWSRELVTGELLQCLPQGAVFVNIGRGRVVADENILAGMARDGRLRVGLDVCHREPLPKNSPLLQNPGVLLSPHIAGPTWDTYPLCGAAAMANVERCLRGEPPEHLVTPEIYDRAT